MFLFIFGGNGGGVIISLLTVFENTKFSPECCPSNYSSSTGCACMTPEQMKFLGQRGGNRTLDIQS